VLAAHEKTAAPIRSPEHPTKAAGTGGTALLRVPTPGTASLAAALDVNSGEVLAEPIGRIEADHFIA